MNSTNKYRVIGLMSGTSLDGLDLVYCEFILKGTLWKFKVIASETKAYAPLWEKKLASAHMLSGSALQLLDVEYGFYVGRICDQFIKKNKIKNIDFIASHGHTIFHQPEKKLTYQIGNGLAIHHSTGVPVINDFRSLDVFKGGQGAPLVPMGDHLLFSNYDVCLNLGGIANLSMIEKGKRIAYDICFANMGLNYLANLMNKKFDTYGKEASKGEVGKKLLRKISGHYDRWRKSKPSLAREGFEKYIQPILNDDTVLLKDRLATFCESICVEIENCVPARKQEVKLLATGGGALNSFLISQLQYKLKGKAEVIVPDKTIVNYKEAIVFALLGILRFRKETNVLRSVTGAKNDSSAGTSIGF